MAKRRREATDSNDVAEAVDPTAAALFNTVFVDTSFDTHLAVIVSNSDTVSDLKEKIVLEHSRCFPEMGELKISSVKVKRKKFYYHLPDNMLVESAFEGRRWGWYLSVDASRLLCITFPQTEAGNLLPCGSLKKMSTQNVSDTYESYPTPANLGCSSILKQKDVDMVIDEFNSVKPADNSQQPSIRAVPVEKKSKMKHKEGVNNHPVTETHSSKHGVVTDDCDFKIVGNENIWDNSNDGEQAQINVIVNDVTDEPLGKLPSGPNKMPKLGMKEKFALGGSAAETSGVLDDQFRNRNNGPVDKTLQFGTVADDVKNLSSKESSRGSTEFNHMNVSKIAIPERSAADKPIKAALAELLEDECISTDTHHKRKKKRKRKHQNEASPCDDEIVQMVPGSAENYEGDSRLGGNKRVEKMIPDKLTDVDSTVQVTQSGLCSAPVGKEFGGMNLVGRPMRESFFSGNNEPRTDVAISTGEQEELRPSCELEMPVSKNNKATRESEEQIFSAEKALDVKGTIESGNSGSLKQKKKNHRRSAEKIPDKLDEEHGCRVSFASSAAGIGSIPDTVLFDAGTMQINRNRQVEGLSQMKDLVQVQPATCKSSDFAEAEISMASIAPSDAKGTDAHGDRRKKKKSKVLAACTEDFAGAPLATNDPPANDSVQGPNQDKNLLPNGGRKRTSEQESKSAYVAGFHQEVDKATCTGPERLPVEEKGNEVEPVADHVSVQSQKRDDLFDAGTMRQISLNREVKGLSQNMDLVQVQSATCKSSVEAEISIKEMETVSPAPSVPKVADRHGNTGRPKKRKKQEVAACTKDVSTAPVATGDPLAKDSVQRSNQDKILLPSSGGKRTSEQESKSAYAAGFHQEVDKERVHIEEKGNEAEPVDHVSEQSQKHDDLFDTGTMQQISLNRVVKGLSQNKDHEQVQSATCKSSDYAEADISKKEVETFSPAPSVSKVADGHGNSGRSKKKKKREVAAYAKDVPSASLATGDPPANDSVQVSNQDKVILSNGGRKRTLGQESKSAYAAGFHQEVDKAICTGPERLSVEEKGNKVEQGSGSIKEVETISTVLSDAKFADSHGNSDRRKNRSKKEVAACTKDVSAALMATDNLRDSSSVPGSNQDKNLLPIARRKGKLDQESIGAYAAGSYQEVETPTCIEAAVLPIQENGNAVVDLRLSQTDKIQGTVDHVEKKLEKKTKKSKSSKKSKSIVAIQDKEVGLFELAPSNDNYLEENPMPQPMEMVVSARNGYVDQLDNTKFQDRRNPTNPNSKSSGEGIRGSDPFQVPIGEMVEPDVNTEKSESINFKQYFIPGHRQCDVASEKPSISNKDAKSRRNLNDRVTSLGNLANFENSKTEVTFPSRSVKIDKTIEETGRLEIFDATAAKKATKESVDDSMSSSSSKRSDGFPDNRRQQAASEIQSMATSNTNMRPRNFDDSAADEHSDSSTDYSSSSGYSVGGSEISQASTPNGASDAKCDDSSAKHRVKSNFSGQNITMDTILRSSSHFKKAKVMASQNQHEDSLAFVPDSQPAENQENIMDQIHQLDVYSGKASDVVGAEPVSINPASQKKSRGASESEVNDDEHDDQEKQSKGPAKSSGKGLGKGAGKATAENTGNSRRRGRPPSAQKSIQPEVKASTVNRGSQKPRKSLRHPGPSC